MSDFDWSQDIKPDHRNGAGISGEELYQALIERMKKERIFKQLHHPSCGVWMHADRPEALCTCGVNKNSHGLNRAELRADSEGVHAPTCKAPFGVCTCSAGDNF